VLPNAIVIVVKLKIFVPMVSFSALGLKKVTPGVVIFNAPSTPVDPLLNGVPVCASEWTPGNNTANHTTDHARVFPLFRLL
jgi:hypothetical protein